MNDDGEKTIGQKRKSPPRETNLDGVSSRSPKAPRLQTFGGGSSSSSSPFQYPQDDDDDDDAMDAAAASVDDDNNNKPSIEYPAVPCRLDLDAYKRTQLQQKQFLATLMESLEKSGKLDAFQRSYNLDADLSSVRQIVTWTVDTDTLGPTSVRNASGGFFRYGDKEAMLIGPPLNVLGDNGGSLYYGHSKLSVYSKDPVEINSFATMFQDTPVVRLSLKSTSDEHAQQIWKFVRVLYRIMADAYLLALGHNAVSNTVKWNSEPSPLLSYPSEAAVKAALRLDDFETAANFWLAMSRTSKTSTPGASLWNPLNMRYNQKPGTTDYTVDQTAVLCVRVLIYRVLVERWPAVANEVVTLCETPYAASEIRSCPDETIKMAFEEELLHLRLRHDLWHFMTKNGRELPWQAEQTVADLVADLKTAGFWDRPPMATDKEMQRKLEYIASKGAPDDPEAAEKKFTPSPMCWSRVRIIGPNLDDGTVQHLEKTTLKGIRQVIPAFMLHIKIDTKKRNTYRTLGRCLQLLATAGNLD